MASDSPGHFDVIACPVCHRGMVLQNTSGGVKALEKDERAEKLVEIYNKLKVKVGQGHPRCLLIMRCLFSNRVFIICCYCQ